MAQTTDFGSTGYNSNMSSGGKMKRSGSGISNRAGGDSRDLNDTMGILDNMSDSSVRELRERFMSVFSGFGDRMTTTFRGIDRRYMYWGIGAIALFGLGYYFYGRRSSSLNLGSWVEGVIPESYKSNSSRPARVSRTAHVRRGKSRRSSSARSASR